MDPELEAGQNHENLLHVSSSREENKTGRNMKTKNKSGFSLIEIMVAVILLVTLALGGAAVMYQTGGSIQRQQNKREALVAANFAMESFWNQNYDSLRSLGGTQSSTNADVNGQTMTMTVDILPEDVDIDGNSNVVIVIDVDHMGSDDVIIRTLRYPFGIGRAAL